MSIRNRNLARRIARKLTRSKTFARWAEKTKRSYLFNRLRALNIDCSQSRFPVRIRPVAGKGIGVFAISDIPTGALVARLNGERIGFDECHRLIRRGLVRSDDPIQTGSHEYIILDAFGHAFNHSCEPSLGIRGESEVFALKDIRSGEELCFDYSATVPASVTAAGWSMKCACGATCCRHEIGNVLTISPEQLRFYLENDAVTSFVMRDISAQTGSTTVADTGFA
jgi:hypothetical protein